ncbi:MAG: ABC transporter ATP-binding protein [Planctomycetaceae bacterium]|nr:MAG: ABC transporter ATP-binding protein [Planctomycetaceae bacterium]
MIDIVAEDLAVNFRGGHAAVDGVCFRIAAGEFVSIVGPSGCGKSTLLRLIAGLIAPTRGSLTVAGRSPAENRKKAHRLSFVFQEPNLLPWRTVADNIRLPLELQGVPADRQRALIAESLRLIGLQPSDVSKRPAMLSGGMKMRVSLARALVTSPNLILLDEPFAALDDLMRTQLNEELNRLWNQQQWTSVFVTHNVAEAVYLSQRVLVMSPSPGRIIAEVDIPFGLTRPSDLRSDARFARLCGEVSQILRTGAVLTCDRGGPTG